MADTSFVPGTTIASTWLNDINDAVYKTQDGLGIIPLAGSVATAISDAISGNYLVGVLKDLTVQIPTDVATLQIALDRLYALNPYVTITLNIASGHTLSTGVILSAKNCGQFRITSTDAEVPVSVGYNVNVFQGTNGAIMPRLATLINCANQVASNGISLDDGVKMIVEPGAGCKNCYGNGLGIRGNCFVLADGGIFTGCARNGVTGAGITAWGSFASAEGADVSDSLFYGAQAAHGGILSFRLGIANNCFRHGIRATDAAIVDADAASANDCAADTLGYSVYAYQAGVVNFVNGSATGNLGTAALLAFGAGSAINAEGATVTGATSVNVFVRRGGRINVVDATVSGAPYNYKNQGGDIFRNETAISSAPVPPESVTIATGDVLFNPSPSGITYIRVNNEGGAATDNVDTITPAPGFVLVPGHIIIITTVTSAEDPSFRDQTVSGAGGNYALRTVGNATVTLVDSTQVIAFMWLGSFWSQLIYAAN